MHRLRIPILAVLSLLSAFPAGAARDPLSAPDRRTEQVLDAAWQYAEDPEGVAPRAEWAVELPAPKLVTLPHVWHPSGRFATCDAVWYATDLTIPADTSDASALLHIDNAVGGLEVFLDGAPIASLFGNGLPRRVVLHGAPGSRHHLACRIDRTRLPHTWPTTIGCGLGPVRISALPAMRIDRVSPLPNPAGNSVTVRYHLSANKPGDAVLRLEVYAPGKRLAVAHQTLPIRFAGDTVEGERVLMLKNITRWSPRLPQFYRLRAILTANGRPVDTCDLPFGAAEFTLKNRTFFLNGEPILLKGLRLCGGAELVSGPPVEAVLQQAQRAGFNAIMTGDVALPERVLTAADNLGLLVIGEIPLGAGPADAPDPCPEVTTAVDTYGAHPSVVVWSWPANGALDRDLVALRACDTARLALVRAGIESQAYKFLSSTGQAFLDPDAGQLNLAETSTLPVLATDLSEDTSSDTTASARGPWQQERSLGALRAAVESVRRSRHLLGYFVRTGMDNALITPRQNGVTTKAFTAALAYNQSCIIALRTTGGADGAAAKVDAALINDQRLATGPGHRYRLYQMLTLPDGQTHLADVCSSVFKYLTGEAIQTLDLLPDSCMLATDALRQPGTYHLRLVLSDETATQIVVIATAQTTWQVTAPVENGSAQRP